MRKACPALIALFIALVTFAGAFFGYNASVFLDVLQRPERRAAWYSQAVVSSAIPAVIFALVFIAAYFYRAEKKNKQDSRADES